MKDIVLCSHFQFVTTKVELEDLNGKGEEGLRVVQASRGRREESNETGES